MAFLVAGLPLAAQERSVLRPERKPADETMHQIARLRSEDTRSHASYALWRLGEHAVPGLIQAARGPDEQMALECIRILGLSGNDARAAVVGLETMSAGGDGPRAVAARWALVRIRGSGTILVSAPRSNELVELERDGRLRQAPIRVWGIHQGVRSGRASYLVTSRRDDRIREVDWQGREIWASPPIPELEGAWPLPNGNLLVATRAQGSVMELDRWGRVNRVRRGLDVSDVELLVDGNLLVSVRDGKTILELDRDLRTVRQFAAPSAVTAAHRLRNGNTVVGSATGVVWEIDMAGNVLHTYFDLPGVADLQCTQDGMVLVAWDRGVTAFSSRNGELWRFHAAHCTAVSH